MNADRLLAPSPVAPSTAAVVTDRRPVEKQAKPEPCLKLYSKGRALYDRADGTGIVSWTVVCACPCGHAPIHIHLTFTYNRRGHPVQHSLAPDEVTCPRCGDKLHERTLLFVAMAPCIPAGDCLGE